MRCNPPYMIPVLAEPMSLPNAAWSTEPINVKESLDETAHELEPLINKQLEASAKSAPTDQNPLQAKVQQQKIPPVFTSITYIKIRSNIISSIRRYALIALILVLISGLLVYYVTHRTPALQSTNISSGGNSISTSPFGQNYTVRVPGGCNASDKDWWSTGAYFKTLDTPTATAVKTNTPPKETSTPHVVQDDSTMPTCQQDGLLVQHNKYYGSFGEVFFQGNGNETLPQHFSTQITATALNPSDAATFTLGVRQQLSGQENYDRGYGNDMLNIGTDGSWETVRINDVTDQVDTTFTKGFIKPSQTFTLGAEVDGSRITFSINGQKLIPIVDTKYPHGYSIGFGLGDSNATSPTRALYSNFSYEPLPNTNLTLSGTVATATTQANLNMYTPYMATKPGFDCDQGAGQWKPVTKDQNYATTSCQSNGLALSQDASAPFTGYESFYGLDGNLPTNYHVQVQIDISGLGSGCAGIMTRADTRAAGYNFEVCSYGFWQLLRYDSNGGEGHKLAEGSVNPQNSYLMVATSQGDTQSLSLDGLTITTIHDSALSTTDHIDLTMYAGQGTAGTAIFSSFVFTPIP
jgi:hypothetical protein